MASSPPETYTIDVEGIGRFQVFRRTPRLSFAVMAEMSELTYGVEPLPSWLSAPAEVVSTLKVLVCQPDTGWPVGMGDPQGIDPLDPDHEPRLKMAMRVVAEVKKAEARFRLQAQANAEVAGGQAQEEH